MRLTLDKERLDLLLHHTGLSNAELARQAGIWPETISRWRSSKIYYPPALPEVWKVKNVFKQRGLKVAIEDLIKEM